MRRLAALIVLLVSFAIPSHAQAGGSSQGGGPGNAGTPAGGTQQLGNGWKILQHKVFDHICSNANTCAITVQSTGVNHVGVLAVMNYNVNNDMTFSSITGGGGSWANCAACHASGFGAAGGAANNVVYNLTLAAGTTALTVNLTSANNTSVSWGIVFYELAWSGTVIAFDLGNSSGVGAVVTCTNFVCPSQALAITGVNDFILQMCNPTGTSITGLASGSLTYSVSEFIPLFGSGFAATQNVVSGSTPAVTWQNAGATDTATVSAFALKGT